MGYRDDHEAALARVSALERELARATSDDAERDARVAALEAELRGARDKLEAAEAQLAKLRPPPEPARPPEPVGAVAIPGLRWSFVLALAAVVLLTVTVVAARAWRARPEDERAVLPRPRAVPSGLDRTSAVLADARTRAKKVLPGSRIIAIWAEGVDEQGALDAHDGRMAFDLHRGRPRRTASDLDDCFTLRYEPDGWIEVPRERPPEYCQAHVPRDPAAIGELACTMQQIWARAIRDGARSGFLATISYQGEWKFTIPDAEGWFTRTYQDDCGDAP